MAQLDALTCVVDPGEVDHEGGLDRAPHPGCRVAVVGFVGATYNPIKNVEEAVCAQCDEVVRVNDCGNSGLAQEEKLRDDADGFEDFGEYPEDLFDRFSSTLQSCRGTFKH